jgi:hypothetical protein
VTFSISSHIAAETTSRKKNNNTERSQGARRSRWHHLRLQSRGWRGAISNAPKCVLFQSSIASYKTRPDTPIHDYSLSVDLEPYTDQMTPGASRKIEQKKGQRSPSSVAAIGAQKEGREEREKQREPRGRGGWGRSRSEEDSSTCDGRGAHD